MFILGFDMNAETAAVVSFGMGLVLMGSCIWYFLPDSTKKWLTFFYDLFRNKK